MTLLNVSHKHLISLAVTVFTILIATPSIAFALAPSPPAVFIQASPASQDVAAGASTTFKIDVVPQGTWETGKVTFDITGLPAGVIATVDSNPATVTADGASLTLTVKAGADAAVGSATVKIAAAGVASSGEKSESDATVTLNVKAGGAPGPAPGPAPAPNPAPAPGPNPEPAQGQAIFSRNDPPPIGGQRKVEAALVAPSDEEVVKRHSGV